MDFELSSDQEALRDGVRALCEGRFTIEFTPGSANILMADHKCFPVRETGGNVRESLRDGFFPEGRRGPTGIAER